MSDYTHRSAASPDFPDHVTHLSHADLLRFLPDLLHRLIIHHGLWFTEVRHQMGTAKALEAIGRVFETSFSIQMKRLSKTIGFEMVDGLPKALVDLPREKLIELIDEICKNWLANDGVWFQSIEFKHGMNDAKRCNDSCWGHFSPFEAWSIKRFLGLNDTPGLVGLAKALGYRIYAQLNRQSVIWENENSLIFQMNDCRVQSARKLKKLDDYPCKSAGLVEYTYFAAAIDPAIKTECLGCPPDAHPEAWYCAWRFTT